MSRFFAFAVVAVFALAPLGRAEDDHPVVKDVKAKLKDPAKPFTMLVMLKIKAGKEDEFIKAFGECQKGTLKEKGTLRYEINRSTEDPRSFVLYEKWKNIDGLAAHIKEAHTEKLLKMFPDLIDGEPSIKVFTAPLD
jgi:quinol monooxygenase YgiN